MQHNAISIEALETLDAIERQGSFAAAAALLNKVPSAITYTVQKLEQELNVQVYEKKGRRSVLTPAGRVLLEEGRNLLEATARLSELAQRTAKGWEPRFNLAIDTAVDSSPILGLINEFYALHSDIEINIFEEALGGGWEALHEEKVDLAIGMPETPSHLSGINTHPYLQSHWAFVVLADHPLAATKKINTQQIEMYRSVVIRDSARNQAKMNHKLFSKQAVLSVQNLAAKIAAQRAGLGIGFLPRERIKEELDKNVFIELQVEGIEPGNMHYIGWRRGHRGKAFNWFLQKLRAF